MTESERSDLEQERYLQERDKFVERLMAQDDPRAKKKCKQDDDGDNEIDGSGGAVDVDRLRVESRRVYLKKRLDRELTLLQQALEDEKELFEGEELTSREREKNPKITTNPKKRRTMMMMTKTMIMTRSTDTFLTMITRKTRAKRHAVVVVGYYPFDFCYVYDLEVSHVIKFATQILQKILPGAQKWLYL